MDELLCTASDTKCGKPVQIQTQIQNQMRTKIKEKICELLAEVQQYLSPEQYALNEIN